MFLFALYGDQKKNNYSQGKRRMNSRTSMAQREEIIKRTVYVSDIDQQVINIKHCIPKSF